MDIQVISIECAKISLEPLALAIGEAALLTQATLQQHIPNLGWQLIPMEISLEAKAKLSKEFLLSPAYNRSCVGLLTKLSSHCVGYSTGDNRSRQ